MRHQRARVRWLCQDPETAWWRFGPLTARSALLLVHSTANSRVNSQTCSLVLLEPAAEGAAGVVPVVPVPQPVIGDAEGGGLVVAPAQFGQLSGVQGGVPAGAGFLHRLVRLAQDADHVASPGLQAAGAEFGDGAASADDVLTA